MPTTVLSKVFFSAGCDLPVSLDGNTYSIDVDLPNEEGVVIAYWNGVMVGTQGEGLGLDMTIESIIANIEVVRNNGGVPMNADIDGATQKLIY
jgi:hypothetical protein